MTKQIKEIRRLRIENANLKRTILRMNDIIRGLKVDNLKLRTNK